MIDLGIDLDGYGDQEPARPRRPAQPEPRFNPDGSATIPLADLQAAGFHHDPDAVRYAQKMQRHHGLIRDMLTWADPFLDLVEPPDCLKANPSHGRGGSYSLVGEDFDDEEGEPDA